MKSSEIRHIVNFLVAKHINDPTHEMRIAFRKLSPAHKWLLFTILESGDRPSFFSVRQDVQKMEARYDILCPAKYHRPFDAILEELSEGFIQIIRQQEAIVGITWIHPSCQDLTIEELAASANERHRFLTLCSREGLEKAMAVAGGAEGTSVMPLFVTDVDWKILHTRCLDFLKAGVDVSHLLVGSHASLRLLEKGHQRKLNRLGDTISNLWLPYYKMAKEHPPTSVPALCMFYEMRLMAKATSSLPSLGLLWTDIVQDIVEKMQDDVAIEERAYSLEHFTKTSRLLISNERRFWHKVATQNQFKKATLSISDRIQNETNMSYDYRHEDPNTLERISKEYKELADQLGSLNTLPDLDQEICDILAEGESHFIHQSDSLQEDADEKTPPENNEEDVWEAAAEIEGREVTLSKLFEDL